MLTCLRWRRRWRAFVRDAYAIGAQTGETGAASVAEGLPLSDFSPTLLTIHMNLLGFTILIYL
jgi:hypothetical protein